ncbi:MAG TPA: FtsX-like permease family protein, partial [Flavitalea sp.]|nr:FtsX-like permease family protein [Flavitalea sp.]
ELLIGFVILLSACFNYTNLSIARSLKRGREVGIRKVAGALRRQVFGQFLMESMINAILAFVLSYVFLSFMIDYMPFLAGGMSKTLIFDDPAILIWYISFCIFTGLLAGVIPALALSSFKPVEVLKNLTQVKLFGGIGLRKSLIVSQFAIALIITIFAGVFSKQFQYMATADPGYNRENMLAIPLQGTDYRYLSDEIRNLNGVRKVSAVSKTLGRGSSGKTSVKFDPVKDPFQIDHFDVDSNFVSIAGLKFAGGIGFTNVSTNTHESEVLINENLMRLMGFKSPIEAVGKPLLLDDSANVVIKGVLKDFHFGGMDFPVTPLLLRNRASQFSMLQVKTDNTTPVIETSVQAIWKRINPGQSFNSFWLKERLYEQQSASDIVSTLGFLAFMTITIAVLGLLGMVIYITQTREKEIGIRKIMGAGVSTIMVLLSKGFLKLILIAGAIAIPLSYIASYFFLNIFATRISLSAATLLPGFIGILLLTLITICWQVYKVAIANPVTSLRSE